MQVGAISNGKHPKKWRKQLAKKQIGGGAGI
jgi:hypothetical protein